MKLFILFLFFCGAIAQNKENAAVNKGDLKEEIVPVNTNDQKAGVAEESLGETPFQSWKTFSNHYYVFNPTPQTWADAQTNCLAMGGYLTVINSFQEQSFVKGLAGGKPAWIGLSDAQQSGSWFWANGEPLGYTNWCPFQPDNRGGKQFCALTNFSSLKCWDDEQCGLLRPYVCERN